MPGLTKLCTPASIYFTISILFMIVVFIQNYGNVNTYCLGVQSCSVSSTYLIFAIKLVYVLFWTWILNLMCNAGASGIAWFLVLIPFIIMFLMLSMMMVAKPILIGIVA